MSIGGNIWMICLKLNCFVYDPNRKLQLSEFVWTLRSSVKVVFNNFLLIDATDRSKITRDQKRLFFAVSPLSFFAITSFKVNIYLGSKLILLSLNGCYLCLRLIILSLTECFLCLRLILLSLNGWDTVSSMNLCWILFSLQGNFLFNFNENNFRKKLNDTSLTLV